jgi:hypothetical protein
MPAEVALDKGYMAEPRRRAAVIGDPLIAGETNPAQILRHDANPFFYGPPEMNKQKLPR